MKKSIAFLLASLAATSSLLFHTQEAKAKNLKKCNGKVSAEYVLSEAKNGNYQIRIKLKDPKIHNKVRGYRTLEEAVDNFERYCRRR